MRCITDCLSHCKKMSWKSGISSLWFRLPDTEIPDGIEDQEPPDETELGHFLSAVGKAHSKL